MKPLKTRTTSGTWKEAIGDFCAATSTLVCYVLVIFALVCITPHFVRGPIRSFIGNYEDKSFGVLTHISDVLNAIFGMLIISTVLISYYLTQLINNK
jgi:hypothetical protein